MKLAIFGATGALGGECLRQAVEAGHEITVLVRTPAKLAADSRDGIRVVEGDALDPRDVETALSGGIEAVLFAIGVDRASPEDLCTDATRNILTAMRKHGVRRFVWCGGGSTLVAEDQITFGARFVEVFTRLFMALRHRDKVHQLELLEKTHDVEWCGLRPLQMNKGPKRAQYRLGFDAFSGLSSITFADCAHAMLKMLNDETWLQKAPIIQY